MTPVRSVSASVPAKINLSLGVGPRRDDGYHPLATVYQSVSLHDEVRATETSDGSIEVSVHFEGDQETERGDVPLGPANIAVRAAELLRAEAGNVDTGVHLAIRKSIPVAGGMAGGSADAAAAMVACNELWGLGLARDELEHYAAELGSDVPFCIRGGIAVGAGRGEQVSPVLAQGHYHWVFAIAEEGLSTAEVFAEYDRLNEGRAIAQPEVPADLIAALRAGDATALGRALTNDLSDAALSLRPELATTLELGESCDVLGSLISGSGPTVMFLVRDEEHALDVAVALSSARVCADVVQALGPVPGARLV